MEEEDEWSDSSYVDFSDYDDDLEDCTLLVHGITQEIKDDLLRLYFENSRRSGGGDIEEIRVDRSNGSATIIYQDPTGKNGPFGL